MTTPLSGDQFELSHGDYAATIASIGASIRSLTHRGRNLVIPFDADEPRPAFRGATLAPWPNRIVDGRYSFQGRDFKLALTEPDRSHALHGLLVWSNFEATLVEADRVVLEATIQAELGYPFRIVVSVEFALSDRGLTQTVTATNTGADAAPFGTGPHPYLVAGDGTVDGWTLTLPAEQVLTVTEDRLIPIGLESVEGTSFDFRTSREIGDTFIDHAYSGLTASTVTLTAPEGTGVSIEWDAACSWVQIHTADQPVEAESRLGLAVEPMTCAPDAFNSGAGLLVIEPGDSTSASWTITAL